MFTGCELSDWQSLATDSHMTERIDWSEKLLDACRVCCDTYENATL
jgi:hypothetical protein